LKTVESRASDEGGTGAERVPWILPGWSPTTITAKESQINAGLYGPSQTMGMTTAGAWPKEEAD